MNLKKLHNKLVTLVNSQTEKLSNLVLKLDDVIKRMDLLLADNESFKDRVWSLENNIIFIKQTNSAPIISNNLINEMINR